MRGKACVIVPPVRLQRQDSSSGDAVTMERKVELGRVRKEWIAGAKLDRGAIAEVKSSCPVTAFIGT
jgi:hypothetical protein